jgi:hypothetical protein
MGGLWGWDGVGGKSGRLSIRGMGGRERRRYGKGRSQLLRGTLVGLDTHRETGV